MRVPRNLDPALYHCPVPVEFLSVSDPTMILMVELLESFISACEYLVQCPSLWFAKKPSVLLSETILSDLHLKAGSHSETYLLLPFEQSAWIYCNQQCTEFSLISVIESARCAGKIAEVSSEQQHIQKAWDDDCDTHWYPLAGWFRAHIPDRIECIIFCLLSFRIRYTVLSNASTPAIPCLNVNELRTYSVVR